MLIGSSFIYFMFWFSEQFAASFATILHVWWHIHLGATITQATLDLVSRYTASGEMIYVECWSWILYILIEEIMILQRLYWRSLLSSPRKPIVEKPCKDTGFSVVTDAANLFEHCRLFLYQDETRLLSWYLILLVVRTPNEQSNRCIHYR